jgi:hypothetical protein
MKKTLFYLITVILILTSFAGCMGTDKNEESSSSANSKTDISSNESVTKSFDMN